MKTIKKAKAGIYKSAFSIPEVSKYVQIQSTKQIIERCTNNMMCLHRLGTWKITAHFDNDEDSVASTEFKVQQFGELNLIVYVCCGFFDKKVTVIPLFFFFLTFLHSPVMPSFEVSLDTRRYILLTDKEFEFTLSAK